MANTVQRLHPAVQRLPLAYDTLQGYIGGVPNVSPNTLEQLIRSGLYNPKIADEFHVQSLKRVIQVNRVDLAKVIVKYVDINDPLARPRTSTAFSSNVDDKFIKLLYSFGADPTETDDFGRTPFFYGHINSQEAIDVLVEAGVDINKRDNNERPAIAAMWERTERPFWRDSHGATSDKIKHLVRAGFRVRPTDKGLTYQITKYYQIHLKAEQEKKREQGRANRSYNEFIRSVGPKFSMGGLMGCHELIAQNLGANWSKNSSDVYKRNERDFIINVNSSPANAANAPIAASFSAQLNDYRRRQTLCHRCHIVAQQDAEYKETESCDQARVNK